MSTREPAPAPPAAEAHTRRRRLLAEYLGSMGLATVVIGSGIAAQQLTDDPGVQLLANAAATGAGLYVLILLFSPTSGAHFNPVVTVAGVFLGNGEWRDVAAYVGAQLAGCASGAVLANLMFGLTPVSVSATSRASGSHALAEVAATAGLVLVIFLLVRSGRTERVAAAVGAYIGAAYFVTSSTSFANPAITFGRMFSDTFAGISPASAPLFIAAQIAGGALAVLLVRALSDPAP